MYEDYPSGRYPFIGQQTSTGRSYPALPTFPPKSEDDDKKIGTEPAVSDDRYVRLCNHCDGVLGVDDELHWPGWLRCVKCRATFNGRYGSFRKMLKSDWEVAVAAGELKEESDPPIRATTKSLFKCRICSQEVIQDTVDLNWFKCLTCNELLGPSRVLEEKKEEFPLVVASNLPPVASAVPSVSEIRCTKCWGDIFQQSKDPSWYFCHPCSKNIHRDMLPFYRKPSV